MIYGLCYTTTNSKARSNILEYGYYEKPYGEAEYIHIDMVEDKEIVMDRPAEYFLKYVK